jgi:beta-glucanase (GH16 family)
MMLSAMADKIQQHAKEVTSAKDRLDKAETRYDDLEIRHSFAGSEEEKCTIAVAMKILSHTIET